MGGNREDSTHIVYIHNLKKLVDMKYSLISSVLAITLATASPHYGAGSVAHWKPAGKGDCE